MAINPKHKAIGCATCRGAFQVIAGGQLDMATMQQQLEDHLKVCTAENPYKDDPNIKGFA